MFIVRNITVFILVVLCYAIPSAFCQTQPDPTLAVQKEAEKGKYQLIDVDRLREIYQDSSSNLLLIDTRQDWEYRTGHITNAMHFSMEPTWISRLMQRHALAQTLGPDKDKILVFY